MPKVAKWVARCHETVIVFAKIGEATFAGKDPGFPGRKWSSGPQTHVFLDVGPGRRRCGLGQSAICRKNASFCHGKVDVGPGRRRCGLGHSAICRERTSFYHGKVDIGAPILDAVANFGGKRRFGSRPGEKPAGAHGSFGRSTGLGKELGLVHIY